MSMTDKQLDVLFAEARKNRRDYPHLEINFENRLQTRIEQHKKPGRILEALPRPALATALACLLALGTYATIGLLNASSTHEAEFYTQLDDYLEMLLPENGDLLTLADIWPGDHFELPIEADLR
jgi:hypothetical protein